MRHTGIKPLYFLLVGGVAIVVFLLAIWFPSAQLSYFFLSDPSLSPFLAARLIGSLLISSITDASWFLLGYTALSALLIGINIALFAYYIRLLRITPSLRQVAGGVLGSFLALLGFGCVSCGSLFFTALFTAASGAGLLLITPYLSIGVGILGILLLITSIVYLSREIDSVSGFTL